jgi:hypothetical protein
VEDDFFIYFGDRYRWFAERRLPDRLMMTKNVLKNLHGNGCFLILIAIWCVVVS